VNRGREEVHLHVMVVLQIQLLAVLEPQGEVPHPQLVAPGKQALDLEVALAVGRGAGDPRYAETPHGDAGPGQRLSQVADPAAQGQALLEVEIQGRALLPRLDANPTAGSARASIDRRRDMPVALPEALDAVAPVVTRLAQAVGRRCVGAHPGRGELCEAHPPQRAGEHRTPGELELEPLDGASGHLHRLGGLGEAGVLGRDSVDTVGHALESKGAIATRDGGEATHRGALSAHHHLGVGEQRTRWIEDPTAHRLAALEGEIEPVLARPDLERAHRTGVARGAGRQAALAGLDPVEAVPAVAIGGRRQRTDTAAAASGLPFGEHRHLGSDHRRSVGPGDEARHHGSPGELDLHALEICPGGDLDLARRRKEAGGPGLQA
jgi:hypothetical protein